MSIKRFLIAWVCCLGLILTACGGSAGGKDSAADSSQAAASPAVLSGEVKVIIQLQAFTPRSVAIRRGTKVTWTNQDFATHNVHAESGLFISPLLVNRQSFTFTFEDPGIYPYYCDQHGGPGGKGMSGVIEVVP